MPLTSLSPSLLDALEQHAGRLKHDLGKYVSLQLRWLGEDADAASRREALQADLLHTRRGPDGSMDAPTVWAEFRPAFRGTADLPGGLRADLSTDPDLEALDVAMTVVSEVAQALGTGTAGSSDIERGAAAAAEVAERCRSLHRRIREARESQRHG